MEGRMIPGQRKMLAKFPSGGAASFKTLSLVTDQDLAEGDIRLAYHLGISPFNPLFREKSPESGIPTLKFRPSDQ